MTDITQVPDGKDKVTFSANSVAGDIWMRENYGDQCVTLEIADALEFKEQAQESGFSIGSV